MNRLLRGIALAAAGAAAMSLYRQWQRMPEAQRRRQHLESWENEGGALPEGAPKPEADVHPRRYNS
jgi:hypothetical protein